MSASNRVTEITTCLDCAATLSTDHPGRKKTGYCRRCLPKHKWTPESRANASVARKARWEREFAEPGKREAVSSWGREARKRFPQTAEVVARQVATRRSRYWCPEGYQALNRQLKNKGYLAAERKQLIATAVLADAARREAAERARVAALLPFERQLEALRNGAKLIEKPVFRRAEHAFTLGGVSAGL